MCIHVFITYPKISKSNCYYSVSCIMDEKLKNILNAQFKNLTFECICKTAMKYLLSYHSNKIKAE